MIPALPVLISAEQIHQRVGELAAEIAPGYRGRALTIVGVLTGSLMFLSDLVRRLDVPLRIGFVQASSYRGATTQPGQLHIDPEMRADVRGRHVLLLDDILDTGQTLRHLAVHLSELGAASVQVAVLLRKQGRQVHPVRADYVGFDIPDEFVVGYGLDFNDEYRHLPYVAVLPREMVAGSP
jgi:hypoxanthine phosphoribosyltransferase